MTTPVAGAHYPRSTGEFLSWFGTDDDCLDYLEWLRWPGGFVCPDCGHAGGWRLGDGRVKCGGCGSRTSVTAGTIFDKTRTPLTVWFHACWLFATAKDGISAQHLQRVLEISSYQTAWAMLHRLRSALVRPGRDRLSGTVEVDETYIGGEEPGLRGGRQRGKKVLTGIAVEVREPKGIGRCRMAPLDDASGDTLGTFVTENVQPGATVITDGWAAYRAISGKGYQHRPINQKAARAAGDDPDSLLPGVHRVASLCKRWLLGTHQGSVDAAHLPAYLNEFVFRFNRRRAASRGMVFYRVLQLAAGHEPVRYVDLLASKKPRRAKRAEGGTGHPPSLERPAADRPWRTAEIQLQFPVRLSGYPGAAFTAPPPRVGDPPAWDPKTSTFIFGARDAVLVDALMTVPEATALADWIALHQRQLTTIYITHGHADHFLGLPVLLDRFPGARAVATPGTVQQMRKQSTAQDLDGDRARSRHLIPVREDAGAPICGCCADGHGDGSLAVGTAALRLSVSARGGSVTALPVAWRRSKTSRTAIEPSPIAVATRLTDPLRTSPTAKTPGLAGFQEQGCPLPVLELGLRDVAASEQEPVGVLGELARQPAGTRLGTDEDEQAPDGQRRRLLRCCRGAPRLRADLSRAAR